MTELPVAGEKGKKNKEETQKREERELKTLFRKSQCGPERRRKKKVHTHITAWSSVRREGGRATWKHVGIELLRFIQLTTRRHLKYNQMLEKGQRGQHKKGTINVQTIKSDF